MRALKFTAALLPAFLIYLAIGTFLGIANPDRSVVLPGFAWHSDAWTCTQHGWIGYCVNREVTR